ncbi:hypothetical protein GCM10011339_29050 [Echinicola rosea]|uniref:Uncharacterized protein n=1 Tax=Echinicola rosea TaxID=1807691 RepID=A0ABQ1V4X8_9BACT|nr:hypothetical protein GCM10011339_29050 [Echinicola rosea]
MPYQDKPKWFDFALSKYTISGLIPDDSFCPGFLLSLKILSRLYGYSHKRISKLISDRII